MKTQIPLHEYPAATSIGLDFINAEGNRQVTCQLINGHGTAIATANFINGKLIGHGVRPEVDFMLFLGCCSSLVSKT